MKKSEQGKYRCPRNGNDGCGKDSRRNNSGAPWDQSEVGKKWTSMGYPGGLPKDETITLQNAEERKRSFTGGKSVCYAQHSDEQLISRELINFSLYDDVQAGNRRKRRRATSAISNRGDEAPALLGRLLLDSGALGRCVVSSSFFDKIVRCEHDIAEHNVEHDLISALDNNVITNLSIF